MRTIIFLDRLCIAGVIAVSVYVGFQAGLKAAKLKSAIDEIGHFTFN